MEGIPEPIKLWIEAVKKHNEMLCNKIKTCQGEVAAATRASELLSAGVAAKEENLEAADAEKNRLQGLADASDQRATELERAALKATRESETLLGEIAQGKTSISALKENFRTIKTQIAAAAQANNIALNKAVTAAETAAHSSAEAAYDKKLGLITDTNDKILNQIARSLYGIQTCNDEGKIESESDTIKLLNLEPLPNGGRRRSKKSKRKKSKNTRKRRKSRKSYR
jgi:hypothetical protein